MAAYAKGLTAQMDTALQPLANIWTLSLLLAACLALPSGILQGYAGFGGALFAAPFFALLFGPATGFSMLVILMLVSQAPLFPEALRNADWKEFLPPSIAAAITMPLGISFLVAADPTFIRRGMGVFILLITVVMMLGYRYTGKRRIWVGIGTGGAAGAISGFFGVPAFPLAAIYLHHADRSPAEIRANVLAAICCTLTVYLIVLSLNGAYNRSVLVHAAILTPIFTAGVYLGQYLFRIAPIGWFKKITYAILICTAFIMMTAA
jgi:uncharacterized membrane protein YfcA